MEDADRSANDKDADVPWYRFVYRMTRLHKTERKTTMKMLVLMAAMPLVAMAETVELPKVPEPRFADCEESLSKPMALWKEGTRTVTTTIECDCTGHNALRVGFGKDANKNGELELHELRLQFGWDATGWVLRSVDQWLDFEEPVKIEKERRTLKVDRKSVV